MSRPGLKSISASTMDSGISSALRRRASLLPEADTSKETLPLSAVNAERIEFLSLYLTVRNAISSTSDCFSCQDYLRFRDAFFVPPRDFLRKNSYGVSPPPSKSEPASFERRNDAFL